MLLRAFLLLGLAAPGFSQTTWYVDASSPHPPGTGTKSHPYASLQHAIDQLATLSGDTLMVASGQYPEDLDLGNKQLSILGHGSSQPVLSGAGMAKAVLLVEGNKGTPWLRIENICFDGSDGQRLIECADSNLTIKNSSFLGGHDQGGPGGQMAIRDSHVALEGCTMTVESAAGTGGSLWAKDSTVLIESCLYQGAESGLAVTTMGDGIYAEACQLTVRSTTFVGLTLSDGVGGALAINGGQAQIEDSLIKGCGGIQSGAGGLYAMGAASVTLLRTRFESCSASQYPGGAVWLQEGYLYASACEFTSNRSVGGDGGAVYVGLWALGADKPANNARADFENCRFTNNETSGEPGWGMGDGGAVFGDDDVSFRRCTFDGNTANGLDPSWGVGPYSASGGAVTQGSLFENCLFFGNQAIGWLGPGGNPGRGGAIGIGATIRHCTFDRNVAGSGGLDGASGEGGAVYSGLVLESIIRNCGPLSLDPNRVRVSYSNVDSSWTGGGKGNIDEDPLFADAGAGDYSLLRESPCIDAGDPAGALDADGTRSDQGAIAHTWAPN